MKYWALACFTLALAACGGNSTGGNPIAPPTPTPVAYQAQLVFKGPLAGAASGISTLSIGRSVQSMNQRGILAAPGATPAPIMVVTALAANGTLDGSPSNIYGGTVQAVVSPAPSSSPSAAFSNTNNAAVLGSISPAPTLPANVVAEQNVTSGNVVDTQSAGTVTATISSPVNQSVQTPVYAYAPISVTCENPEPAGSAPGWAYVNSAWVTESTPAASDIYLTGPDCPGSFYAATADAALNFPGGGLLFSTDTPFSSLTASQWVATQTSVDMQTIDALNPDGSQNTELLAKTRGGAIFKLFPNSFGPVPGDISGAIEVSGNSIDGF